MDQRCHLPISLHPWTSLRCQWERGLNLARRSHHTLSSSCMLGKPAAAAAARKTWEQAWAPEPTIRHHPRCREVLESSRVITGGKEYSWQASPNTERNPENKFKKLSKMWKAHLWCRYANEWKSQDLMDQVFWRTKVLGDFWLIAPLSL